ncbi:MFS transporter [Streptomonospora salina]|uniref:MFS family permease n=1 Tax=Streptomonospora salina TaxID=104205 RepID=A0A841EK92_9ACTN|nr:MFS transporter [Streptomonospora salina]MBB6000760.1 MFS family permease [Streptomonospora salina]
MPATTPPPARTRRGVPSGAATAIQAAVLVTFLAASSAPTPIYAVYRDSWQLAPSALTVVFGVYALALLVALLVVGRISDHTGRRPAIVGAIALEAASMVVFLAADDLAPLIAARIMQGFATGAATGALGAGLLDSSPTRGPVVTSVAPLAGMGAGALGSSVLVQYAPAPMRLVYVVLLVLLVVQATAIATLGETAERRPGALASLRPAISVPRQARRALLVAAPIDIAVWALGGFYLSLGPALTAAATGSADPLVGGAAVCALTVSGAAAILLLGGAPALRVMLVGAPALAVGVATTLVGVHTGGTPVYFAGIVLAGIGFGAGFQGALRTVVPLAAPHQRAGLMSAFYVLSYLAVCLPAVTAGIAADTAALGTVADVYGTALIALAVLAGVGTLMISRAPDR